MKKLIMIAVALFAACDTPTVPERFLRDVYDFRLLTPAPVTLRWPTGSTVRLFIVPDDDAARTQYLRDAVTHGIEVWNGAALYGEVTLVETSSLQEADVVVEYSHVVSPVELANCSPSGGIAVTTFCLTSDGANLRPFPLTGGGESGVKFVLTVRVTLQMTDVDVRRLVTHELGHVLGIAQHSRLSTDLLYDGTLVVDQPSPRDRATLQMLYHTVPDITP
jgi:hypothetical protein